MAWAQSDDPGLVGDGSNLSAAERAGARPRPAEANFTKKSMLVRRARHSAKGLQVNQVPNERTSDRVPKARSADRLDDLTEVLAREFGERSRKLIPFYEEADKGVYRLDRVGLPWVVRWFPPERPLERVEGDAEILRAVRHLAVERIVETVDGRAATAAHGRGVIVTEFIAGTPAPHDPASLRRLAATLAAVGKTEVAEDSLIARRAGSLPAEDLQAGRAWLDDIANGIPPELQPAFDRLSRDLEETSDCETAASGLVHPDCHVGNVIRTKNGPILFDWEGTGVGPLVAALGWLLFSSAVAGPNREAAGLDAAAVHALIAGYTDERCLSKCELEVLPDATRFRPLVIACRQLRHAVRTGDGVSAYGWWSRYQEAKDVVKLVSAG